MIQWRVVQLDMCTLWQRLDRAAQDRSLDAIAIIFMDSAYFEQEQYEKEQEKLRKEAENNQKEAEKAERDAQKGKKRAVNRPPADDAQHSKCWATTPVGTTGRGANILPSSGSSILAQPNYTQPKALVAIPLAPPPPVVLEDCRKQYMEEAKAKSNKTSVKKKGGKKGRQELPLLPLEIMDLVNADWRHIDCHQTLVKLYFGNDNAGEVS